MMSMQGARAIRFIGHGRYMIDGLRFSRTAWWNVGLTIELASGADSLAFKLILAR